MAKPKKKERAPLQLRFSYCDECSIPLGAGTLSSDAPKHFHQKSQTWHVGKVVNVDAEDAQKPGEVPGKYLDRLLKKYSK